MPIMECRRVHLEQSLNALKMTDQPLIGLSSSHTFIAAGYGDDAGIYYFIPWLANSFGLSIDQAISLFFNSLLILGTLFAITSFFFLFHHWTSRLISAIGMIALALVTHHFFDVYILPFFVTASLIPLLILLTHKPFKLAPFLALSGLIAGYSNMIRAHSGTGTLLFILTWLLLSHRKNKLLLCSVLLLFSILPILNFKYLELKRNEFLAQKNPTYPIDSNGHPIWHSIYLGLSYLQNPYGIEWSDTVALEKAKTINPKIISCSDEYEQILKNQFFEILKNDPSFIIRTLLAKLGNLLIKMAIFANLGLVLLFYVKPPLSHLIPFLLSAIFYALPGLLAIPAYPYVVGLLSVSTLFGIYMTCMALEKLRAEPILTF